MNPERASLLDRSRWAPPATLLITAVLWSLGGVLIKSVEWHPLAIATARSAFALALMVTIMGFPRPPYSRAQLWGAVAYAMTLVLFVTATRLTTAANAIFLQYTSPVYVALLGPKFLGERAGPIDWMVVVVALGGIGLFFCDELQPAGFWGNICALLSGLSMAVMVLLLRAERHGSPAVSVFLGNILAVAIGLPFVFGDLPEVREWGVLAVMGVVQLAIPYLWYTAAIRRVSALEATLIPLLEPVLNPLWVMLAIGEWPQPFAMAGAALVVGAVAVRGLAMVFGRRATEAEESVG